MPGQGRGRRLVAAWLGPAPILTGHHPPAEPCVHNFHPHVNRPHSRPPPPHPAGHKVPAPLLHPSLIFSSSESEPKMNVDCISQASTHPKPVVLRGKLFQKCFAWQRCSWVGPLGRVIGKKCPKLPIFVCVEGKLVDWMGQDPTQKASPHRVP